MLFKRRSSSNVQRRWNDRSRGNPRRHFVRGETRVRAHTEVLPVPAIIEDAYKTRSCCGRVMPNKPVAASYWHTSLCSCPVSTPISNRAYQKYTERGSPTFETRFEIPVDVLAWLISLFNRFPLTAVYGTGIVDLFHRVFMSAENISLRRRRKV